MKSENTIKNYEFALKQYDESNVEPIEYFETLSYSKQKMLFAALKWRGVDISILENFKSHFKKIPFKKVTDTFNFEEIQEIKALALKADPQTRAIVLLQLEAGVRRDEVNKVFEALKNQGVRIGERNVVNISGKGSKYASIFLSKELSDIVAYWIYSPDYKPCCKESVWLKTKKILDRIDGSGSCHDLRRAFATNLRNHNVPIEQIKILLRHDDIRTTCDYIKVTHDQIFDSLSLFYVDTNEFINESNYRAKLMELQLLNFKLVEEVKKYKSLYEFEKSLNETFSIEKKK